MIIEVPLFQEISLALNNSWLCVYRGYFCNTVIHKFFDDQPVRYDLYCFILSFFSVESILLHSFVFVLLFLSLAYLGPSRNINDGVFQRNYSTAFSCIKHKLFFFCCLFFLLSQHIANAGFMFKFGKYCKFRKIKFHLLRRTQTARYMKQRELHSTSVITFFQ